MAKPIIPGMSVYQYNQLKRTPAGRRFLRVRLAHLKVEELTPSQMEAKYYKRTCRYGKTRRDRNSGAHAQRLNNRAARDAWRAATACIKPGSFAEVPKFPGDAGRYPSK